MLIMFKVGDIVQTSGHCYHFISNNMFLITKIDEYGEIYYNYNRIKPLGCSMSLRLFHDELSKERIQMVG